MLRALCYLGNGCPYKTSTAQTLQLKPQTSHALISTNTAINNSLRRSQYEGARLRRRSPGEDGRISNYRTGRVSLRERIRRPNHQQGQDVDDIEEFRKINERNKALNQARTTRRRIRTERTGVASDRRPQEARHDYTPRPGGNRAARRAMKFGHTIEEPLKQASNATIRRAIHEKGLHGDLHRSVRPERRGSTSHRVSGPAEDENENHGYSMPEDLRDDLDDLQDRPRRSFAMGRRDDISYRAIYAKGSRDTYQGPSHSRPFEGYERDWARDDDRSPMHREPDAPLSMPYTTPASEFLYGTSVVVAALLSSRRKLYKLYIYDGDNREIRDQDMRIRRLAVDRSVVVERVKGNWLRLMDKMSMGRPHNVR